MLDRFSGDFHFCFLHNSPFSNVATLLHKLPSIIEGNVQPLEVISGLGNIREDMRTEGRESVFKEVETVLSERSSV